MNIIDVSIEDIFVYVYTCENCMFLQVFFYFITNTRVVARDLGRILTYQSYFVLLYNRCVCKIDDRFCRQGVTADNKQINKQAHFHFYHIGKFFQLVDRLAAHVRKKSYYLLMFKI